MPKTRTCKNCKQELPVDNFYFRKEKGDYRSCCKKCKRVRTKDEILAAANAPTKICTHCNIEKPRADFQKAGGGKWLQPYCKECDSKRKEKWANDNIQKIKEKRKNYYIDNKDTIVEKEKSRRKNNPEKYKTRAITYRHKNIDVIRKRGVEYNKKNSEKIKQKSKERYYANHDYYLQKQREARANRTPEQIEAKRKYDREYKIKGAAKINAWKEKNKDKLREQKRLQSNRKAATCIQYRLKRNLRTRIRCALKDSNAYKIDKSENLLGCTIDFYKLYLQNLFTEGMNWDKFFLGEIEIDHIKPCSKFDLTIEEEQRRCFNYTNTQPLWAIDNMKKGAKYQEAA